MYSWGFKVGQIHPRPKMRTEIQMLHARELNRLMHARKRKPQVTLRHVTPQEQLGSLRKLFRKQFRNAKLVFIRKQFRKQFRKQSLSAPPRSPRSAPPRSALLVLSPSVCRHAAFSLEAWLQECCPRELCRRSRHRSRTIFCLRVRTNFCQRTQPSRSLLRESLRSLLRK
jgi:hypothetical protein